MAKVLWLPDKMVRLVLLRLRFSVHGNDSYYAGSNGYYYSDCLFDRQVVTKNHVLALISKYFSIALAGITPLKFKHQTPVQ